MNIAIIGTGKVGSVALQHLVPMSLGDIYLVNRDGRKSEGVLLDTVSAFPAQHQHLHVGSWKDVGKADIVVITAGPTVVEHGFDSVDELGLKMMKEIISHITLKEEAVVVILTTPIDEVSQYFAEQTGHPASQVLGFGGSLDTARLKYLLAKEIKSNPEDIDCTFIGIHGSRGLPIFDESSVDNAKEIKDQCKNYFVLVKERTGGSTIYGPAWQLARLVKTIATDSQETFEVSAWNERYQVFTTWPVTIGKKGVLGLKPLKLSTDQQAELDKIMLPEAERRTDLYTSVE